MFFLKADHTRAFADLGASDTYSSSHALELFSDAQADLGASDTYLPAHATDEFWDV